MSDRDRVLQALEEAGPRGVHSLYIRRRGLSGNPSERIRELRALGHEITATREPHNGRSGSRYVLATTRASAAPTQPAAGDSAGPAGGEIPEGQLFGLPPTRAGYADSERWDDAA